MENLPKNLRTSERGLKQNDEMNLKLDNFMATVKLQTHSD